MLNIGVIGVGSISAMHINSYLKNKEVNVLAFCDLNSERLQARGNHYGVENLSLFRQKTPSSIM